MTATVARTERYARIPLAARRERRDWPAVEAAASYELHLAAYEVRGRFESLELVRAYLGQRAGAVDALIGRGELAEEDGEWIFLPYFDMYGEDGRLQRRSQAERLQDAADKMARGERLTDAEYAARHRAKRDGVPFPLPQSDVSLTQPDESTTTTTTTTKTTTTTNDESAEDGRLVVELYEGLYGKSPTESKATYLRSLETTYGPRRACNALTAEHAKDPNPRTICGRMEEGLRKGNILKVAS